MKRAFLKRISIAAFVLILSLARAIDPQATDVARLLPAASELPGWVSGGPPERFEREGLYGYINGGSEIFLQYDFRRVDVGRYKKGNGGTGLEVTVDLYRMGSPLDAFGIFSIRRQGGEKKLSLEGLPNWISESQASLAAGDYYVNIIGFGTQNEEMAVFARLLSKKLTAAGERPFALTGALGPWSAFPREGLLNDTLRIIKGKLAPHGRRAVLVFGKKDEAAARALLAAALIK